MRIIWILVLLSGDGFQFRSKSSMYWGWPSEKECRAAMYAWIDKGDLTFGHNVTWTCEPREAGPAPIED